MSCPSFSPPPPVVTCRHLSLPVADELAAERGGRAAGSRRRPSGLALSRLAYQRRGSHPKRCRAQNDRMSFVRAALQSERLRRYEAAVLYLPSPKRGVVLRSTRCLPA